MVTPVTEYLDPRYFWTPSPIFSEIFGPFLKYFIPLYKLVCKQLYTCDRRAEAEVNWTGLTLIKFIVFVHSVNIAT